MKKELFERHITAYKNPDKYGWYPTDKGILYWFNDEKEWSCRDDRISSEYPMYWYANQQDLDTEIKLLRDALVAQKLGFYKKLLAKIELISSGELHVLSYMKEVVNKILELESAITQSDKIDEPKYYYLKKGEIIQEGDEVEMSNKYNEDAKWVKAEHCIGTPSPDPQFMAHRQYRRLIK